MKYQQGGGGQKKNIVRKGSHKDDATWKSRPPKQGELKKKQAAVIGTRNTDYWCQHHAKWTIHKPQDCHRKRNEHKHKPQHNKKKASNHEANKEKVKENKPSLKILMATLQETDSNHETDFINLQPCRSSPGTHQWIPCRPIRIILYHGIIILLFLLPPQIVTVWHRY